jgi:hypothetical protein
MNKNPRKVTMLDVLDALRDRDGRDLFNSEAATIPLIIPSK